MSDGGFAIPEAWLAKFWQRVDRRGPDECWPWTGARRPAGYGNFYPKWKVILGAHRVSWVIANGREIPDGLHVMHSCDNPPCVNPAHLSVGTGSDNAQDSVEKGRARTQTFRGENHPNHKLTDAKVAEIRAKRTAGASLRGLAREYGVSKPTISWVVKGWTWREPRAPLSLRFNLAIGSRP